MTGKIMCGIAGISGENARHYVAPMIRALAHRGPDAEAAWHDAYMALAHRRLSIIDTSDSANQPFFEPEGRYGIVFNGEIYNYRELRRTLEGEGVVFRTQSDTEVLLHWLMSRGPAGLTACNGMFALAFYDARGARPQLMLARDRFGKKPLYYGWLETGIVRRFAFASELRALMACPEYRPRVSATGATLFLMCEHVPDPQSMLAGVSSLAPGSYLTLDVASGATAEGRFWDPGQGVHGSRPIVPPSSYEEALIGLDDRLRQAVKLRLRSDVPLGVLLSGGVDSAAVAALAREMLGRERELHTFSVAFDEADFDESVHAKAVADHLGTTHHEIRFSPAEVERVVGRTLDHLDNPLADAGVFPYMLLSRAVKKHVTVALGGDGGDEVFAGYEPFNVWKKGRWMHRFFGWNGLWRALKAFAEIGSPQEGYMPFRYKMATALRGAPFGDDERLFAWTAGWMPDELREAATGELSYALDRADAAAHNRDAWRGAAEKDWIQRLARAFRATFLQEVLQKVDTASMAHALEVRAPLLDADVVAYAEQLPGKWLWAGPGRGKNVLKDAVRALLPQGALDRRKQGFSIPVYTWLRSGPLAKPLREAVEAESFRALGWFDHDRLTRLIDEHQGGKRNHRKRLLPLLMLAQWHKRWIAR
ncbi:MAG: asparagine synthase (glutamine-hydrolyzing) [Planctomycetes bacterium]|nr:asparagine synthase (glutamine-hydrolyzing) [Planctomycetota bacterium]